MRVASVARLVAAGLVLGLVLFGEIPSRGRWATDLANFAHGPAMAVVTLLVLRLLPEATVRHAPASWRYLCAVAVVLPLAAVIELLQLLLGRDASFADLLRDTLGVGAAIAFSAAFDRRLTARPRGRALRTGGLLVGVICSALLAAPLLLTGAAYLERQRGFPVLVDFRSPYSRYFVAVYGDVRIERNRLPAVARGEAMDTVGLHVQLGRGPQWGLALWEPKPDWRGYKNLRFDIANPTDEPLVLRVRVRDRHPRRDRSERDIGAIQVAPRARETVQVALPRATTSGAVVPIDVANVRAVVLTKSPDNRATAFYVVSIGLE
jgi:hypothetical protein